MIVHFTIPGPPVPKGRPRFVKGEGERSTRAVTPARTRAYETAVGWAYKAAHPGPPHEGDVNLYVVIHEGPGHPGDWDNYGKVISDGLNKIAYLDDRQISRANVRIHRHEPGMVNPRAEVSVALL